LELLALSFLQLKIESEKWKIKKRVLQTVFGLQEALFIEKAEASLSIFNFQFSTYLFASTYGIYAFGS